jgi:hypothetical protein
MSLPQRLLTSAKLFFEAVSHTNVPAILIGGAATLLLQDLDVNVTSLSFKDKPPSQFLSRMGSSNSRLHVTYLHPTQSIKLDVATDHAALVPKVLRYTAVCDGIRYALPNLLLADKIKTYSERCARNDAKR